MNENENEIPRNLLPLYHANSGERFMHERIIRQLIERIGTAEAQLAAKDAVIEELIQALEATRESGYEERADIIDTALALAADATKEGR